MRTHRWPARISVVPAASARARSAALIGVSSMTASHSTIASLPNLPLRSSFGDSDAVPRTPTRARTSCSGPSSSTPSRSSSYGATSMKSSASSSSSSIDVGSCAVARSARTGIGGTIRSARSTTARRSASRCSSPPATSIAR
jgi:hypothetical protein